MRSFDKEERKIVKQLKELPLIKPTMEKDALYEHISQKINSDIKPKKNALKIFPIFASGLAFILIIAALPFLFDFSDNSSDDKLSTANFSMRDNNNNEPQTKSIDKDNREEDLNNHSDSSSEIQAKDSTDGNKEESITSEDRDDKEDGEEEAETDQLKEEKVVINDSLKAHTINQIPDEEKIVHIALPDQQVQYVVPLTIVVDENEEIDDVYNHLNNYVSEDMLGLNEFPLDGVEFDVDLKEKKVNLNIPEDFNLASGSATHNMVEKVLAMMFLPYDIDNIIINNGEGAELNQFGHITHISLMHPESENYKIYQPKNKSDQFIIPIPNEGMSVEEAFNDLKVSSEDFDVYASVPEELNFNIIEDGTNLKVDFAQEINNTDADQLLFMFESMLMTAKSYQFTTVEFLNTGIDAIHEYDLSGPVPVPKAINLIN